MQNVQNDFERIKNFAEKKNKDFVISISLESSHKQEALQKERTKEREDLVKKLEQTENDLKTR